MNNEMIKEVLSRYLTDKEMHPDMFLGMLSREVGVRKNNKIVFWVKDAISTDGRDSQSIIVVDKEALKLADKYLESYVCGIVDNGCQKLLIGTKQEAPVQIIPWEYIDNSNVQVDNMSLIDYLCSSYDSTESTKTIKCTAVRLIGTREDPGHIIIYDTFNNVFLKGFLSVGADKIQYLKDNIYIWGMQNDQQGTDDGNPACLDADFSDVVNFNQSALMQWQGNCFLMVVPKSDNSYMQKGKHSVLDYSYDKCCWLPLTFDFDKKLPWKIGQDEEGEVDMRPDASQDAKEGEDIDGMGAVAKQVTVVKSPQDNDPQRSEALDCDDRPFVDKVCSWVKGKIDGGKQGVNFDQLANGDISDKVVSQDEGKIDPSVGKANDEANGTTKVEAIISEKEFLTRFIKFVKDCGYQYAPRDLIRFHTCAKCGFFTLLGGEPGTGKSSLALLYAKAIAGDAYKDKEQFLRVDVNPGWMEPADLMGYYSSSAKAFLESEVGLVSFLGNAEKATGPRIVCFEEMNLAYVEHYFSDFIQQMSRANGDRAVTIKKREEVCDLISLNDNLRFFGTINFDETTKELSVRFYDRCNYIELSPTDKTFPRLCSPVKNNILCKGDEIPSNVFNEWVDKAWEGKIDEGIMDCLDEVYPILQSLHIAPNWRKACDIYRYIASRPRFLDEESRDDYEEIEIKKGENVSKIKVSKFDLNVLDEVMVQSILPVYRRPNEFREKPQRELGEFLKNKKLNLSKDMFERILGIETPYPDET